MLRAFQQLLGVESGCRRVGRAYGKSFQPSAPVAATRLAPPAGKNYRRAPVRARGGPLTRRAFRRSFRGAQSPRHFGLTIRQIAAPHGMATQPPRPATRARVCRLPGRSRPRVVTAPANQSFEHPQGGSRWAVPVPDRKLKATPFAEELKAIAPLLQGLKGLEYLRRILVVRASNGPSSWSARRSSRPARRTCHASDEEERAAGCDRPSDEQVMEPQQRAGSSSPPVDHWAR